MKVARLTWLLVFLSSLLAQGQTIRHDPARKLVTINDGRGDLNLSLSYDRACVLNQVKVRGREVVSSEGNVFSGIKAGGQWFTTQAGIPTPRVAVGAKNLTVKEVVYGGAGVQVRETWHFTVKPDRVLWRIDREYLNDGSIEDTCFPGWNFKDMSTWTGGLLGNGGVIWNKYIEKPNATFGTHTDSVTFWNRSKRDCLRVEIVDLQWPRQAHPDVGARFSHQSNNGFSYHCVLSPEPLTPKHNLQRFLHDRQDVWKPVKTGRGQTSVEFSLQALDYEKEYSRGNIKGLKEASIREVLNTIARYGVIDRGLVGGNGWRTGWVCLHEQWFAQFGLALADPNYIKTFGEALDYERDHAITSEGRVKSRWHHNAEDAQPGTFDALGFYEAQWGMLLDSQPCYVINVAEQFDLTGDLKWLRGQKKACEQALDYLLLRDSDWDGLVEMMTDSHQQAKGSDWIDIIWASHENALVNAELYYALIRWSEAEELLGDKMRASAYRQSADKLKSGFNRATTEGGFWDAKKQCYIYWRDKDDSIHGNNLVTPVNFAAIAYGLCEDPVRQRAILEQIERLMQKENLFFWPLNLYPFETGEGHANNYPYPKYENGDIFLSWGELGVRSYAQMDPTLAVKYIKKVLERYETDGLSFQRYLRASQKGAGDDILAGNCSAVVGLYRNIYGIQPQHNRLYLNPHLTQELDGTQIRYLLRGQPHLITLHTNMHSVQVGPFEFQATSDFGVNCSKDQIQFFPGKSANCQLAISIPGHSKLSVQIQSWPGNWHEPRRWNACASSSKGLQADYVVSGLNPGARYKLICNGKQVRTLEPDKAGQIRFSSGLIKTAPVEFELMLR